MRLLQKQGNYFGIKSKKISFHKKSKRYASKTALFDLHVSLGGKMVDFAGYYMPVQYKESIPVSHIHTREKSSLFDVSHMGQVKIVGKDRVQFVERITVADVSSIPEGSGSYSLITNEKGGIIDDTIVSNFGDSVGVVVNAGCKEKDRAHFEKQIDIFQKEGKDVRLEWSTNSLLALQGPLSAQVLQRHTPFDLETLDFFRGASFDICGVTCHVSRSGYTGEDGFEISIPYEQTHKIAAALLNEEEVLPAGLGARDTLRLEAGLCLYGNDLTEDITPKQASLTWTMTERRKKEGGFIGDNIILPELDIKLGQLSKRRVGFKVDGRTPIRQGAVVMSEDQEVGFVSSGNMSPTLGYPLGMAYVQGKYGKVGTPLYVEQRGKKVEITIAKMPFIEKGYKK